MAFRFLLPALLLLSLLTLPTPAEASCNEFRYGSKEHSKCEQAEVSGNAREHEEYEKSLRFKVSVGGHSQTITWHDYKKTGVCASTGRDGLHTLSPVEHLMAPHPPFDKYAPGALFMHVNCKDGKRHGDEIRYYASGAVAERAAFEDGEPHGFTDSFDGAGRLTDRATYDEGDLRVRTTFYADGMEQRTEHSWLWWRAKTTYWMHGKLFTGTWKQGSSSDHLMVYQMQDGLLHGPYEEYHRGVLTDRRTYEHGKIVK